MKSAVLHTAGKRDSLDEIKDWRGILHDIREEPALYRLWENYAKENSYASALTFAEVLDTAEEIATLLEL